MSEPLTDRMRAILEGIDARTIPLERPPLVPEDWYCTVVEFKAAGWTIGVFDDCYSWDYIDFMLSPEGERVEYPDGRGEESPEELVVLYYNPAHLEDWGYGPNGIEFAPWQ